MDNKNITASDFLCLGLIAFAGFGMEILLLMLENLLTKDYLNSGLSNNLVHWTITIFLWGLISYFLINYSKDKLNYPMFMYKEIPNFPNILLVGILTIFFISLNFFLWNFSFKPIVEFKNLCDKFGNNYGIIAFIFQYLYYIFEGLLILLSIVFGQKAGELLFKIKKIPWGGIFLSLTWGLAHILTQNISTGLFTLLSSILFGTTYLLLKKNFKYSFVTILAMFIL